MLNSLYKSKTIWIVVILYSLILIWWAKIYLTGGEVGTENYLFGAFYPVLALIGGISGLKISKNFGGFSSVMGKGIVFLSLALLSQVLGQFVWTYYNIVVKVEAPYPSLADSFYLLVIPFNCLAMAFFAKASGITLNLKKVSSLMIAVTIPGILLFIAFWLFLRGYEFDVTSPMKIFLDFAYPIGEAIYLSLAILTYLLTKNILGGVMRSKILFFVFAFFVQFLTDYAFTYSISQGWYYNAGFVDLMYASSFAIYSIALLNLRVLKI